MKTMTLGLILMGALVSGGFANPVTGQRAMARSLGLERSGVDESAMVVRPIQTRTGARRAWLGEKDLPVEVYADSLARVPILFEAGGFAIRRDHPESIRALHELAAVMKAYPNARFVIEGHTCDLGRESVNLRISWSRAEAVRSWLTLRGIDASRLVVLGFGEKEAPKHLDERDRSPAARAVRQAHRRVVVRQLAG